MAGNTEGEVVVFLNSLSFFDGGTQVVDSGTFQINDLVVGQFGSGLPLDVAVATGAGVVVLLDESGSFGSPVLVFTEPAIALAAGNLGGDPDTDLALTHILSPDATVLINDGDGDGSFTADGAVGLGGVVTRADDIIVVDFDGVADTPELVTANGRTGDISVLRSASPFSLQGTFTTRGGLPVRMVAADFSNDGVPDLATVSTDSNNVSVLLNDGAGEFADDPLTSSTGLATELPTGIVAADFDGDTNADLAVASDLGGANVLLGDGLGTFDPAPIAVPDLGGVLAAADLDGDGDIDLASALGGFVTVVLGEGDGTFAAGTAFSTGAGNASDLIAAHLNGDGDLDLATTNQDSGSEGPGTVSVLLGAGAGTFAAAVVYGSGGFGPTGLAAADFDGDCDRDLAVSNLVDPDDPDPRGNVALLRNNDGAGTFVAGDPASPRLGRHPADITAADFDRDGQADVAVPAVNDTSRDVSVLLGDESLFDLTAPLRFSVDGAVAHSGSAADGIVAADFDQDGHADMAVASALTGDVAVLFNEASPPGTFTDLSICKTDSPDPVVVGSPLEYTITVFNDGPSAATNVTVTDELPADVTFVSASASAGLGCLGVLTVTCDLGTLAPGGVRPSPSWSPPPPRERSSTRRRWSPPPATTT